MARIRTIKPSFFESEDVSVLPLRARLTWIGLWTHCDDAGRTKDNAKLIKARIWPLDQVSLRDIEEDLATLAGHGRIVRYEVDGERYLEITNWREHQSINKPTASKIPSPTMANGHTTSIKLSTGDGPGSAPVVVTEDSRQERKGREGKGRDARASAELPADAAPEPPLRCPQHLDNPNPPPCGPCADARRLRDRWETDRRARQRDSPKCPRHRGQLASNCAGCRSESIAARDED